MLETHNSTSHILEENISEKRLHTQHLCVPKGKGSENDAGIMDEVVEQFSRISHSVEKSPTILFITHLNKSGTVRGSTAIEGATPMVILAKRVRGEEESHLVQLDTEWKLEPIDPVLAEFRDNLFIHRESVSEFEETQLAEEIDDHLKEVNKATAKEIAEAIGKREAAVRQFLKKSERFDYEKATIGGKGRPKKVWFRLVDLKSQDLP